MDAYLSSLDSQTIRSIAKVLLGALAGAVVGAFLGHYFTSAREKRGLSVRLIEEYVKRQPDFSAVAIILRGAPVSLEANNEYARVLAVGDWFEVVAALYNRRLANRKLLRVLGIIKSISNFSNSVKKADSPKLIKDLEKWTEIAELKPN